MTRLAFALAVLLTLTAGCGSDDDDFGGEVEETGEPGMFGRLGEMRDAAEQIQQAAERPPADPVNFRVLRDLLPDEVQGVAQSEVEGSTDGAMGFSISRVEGKYEVDDSLDVTIQIVDYGAVPQVGMFGLGWTMADIDRESGSTYERTVTFGGNRGYRTYDSEQRRGEFSLLVADRFHVQVAGSNVPDEGLEAALRAVDLERLADLRDQGRPDA